MTDAAVDVAMMSPRHNDVLGELDLVVGRESLLALAAHRVTMPLPTCEAGGAALMRLIAALTASALVRPLALSTPPQLRRRERVHRHETPVALTEHGVHDVDRLVARRAGERHVIVARQHAAQRSRRRREVAKRAASRDETTHQVDVDVEVDQIVRVEIRMAAQHDE